MKLAPALRDKFGYTSVMEIPKIHKLVVNMGGVGGEAVGDPKTLDAAVGDLTTITGQSP